MDTGAAGQPDTETDSDADTDADADADADADSDSDETGDTGQTDTDPPPDSGQQCLPDTSAPPPDTGAWVVPEVELPCDVVLPLSVDPGLVVAATDLYTARVVGERRMRCGQVVLGLGDNDQDGHREIAVGCDGEHDYYNYVVPEIWLFDGTLAGDLGRADVETVLRYPNVVGTCGSRSGTSPPPLPVPSS